MTTSNALQAENLQLIKEGDVLTSEIQRLNIQWKTVRHENETVKYTVKEVSVLNNSLLNLHPHEQSLLIGNYPSIKFNLVPSEF